MVLVWKTNFSLGKNGFEKENQLFPGENKKKTHLLVNYAANVQNDGFLVFPGKNWFSQPKPSFP